MPHFSLKPTLLTGSLLLWAGFATAQKTIQEYVTKTDAKEIGENIVVNPDCKPITAGGFADGHGRLALMTKPEHLPDTIALATLYIYDIGTSNHIKNISISYYSVSEKGGNIMANAIADAAVADLKKAFREKGIVLLTPEEYLNTPEKREYYYNTFAPPVSKLGKYLSNLETKRNDVSVTADNYRAFDISAAGDHLRAEAMGYELAKKLGVDAVMSVAVELMSTNREIFMNGLKMNIQGPNPVPKEDKKYVAQNMGNGYYNGQVYSCGSFYFKKPVLVGNFQKSTIVNINFNGLGQIFSAFANRLHEVMHESMTKAMAKYNK